MHENTFHWTRYASFITNGTYKVFIANTILRKLSCPQRALFNISCIVSNHEKHLSYPQKYCLVFIQSKETIFARKKINKQKRISDLSGMFSQNTFIYNSLQVKKWLQIAFCECIFYPHSRQQGIDLWRERSCSYTASIVGHGSGISSSHQPSQTPDSGLCECALEESHHVPDHFSLYLYTHFCNPFFFSLSSLYCSPIRNSECKRMNVGVFIF